MIKIFTRLFPCVVALLLLTRLAAPLSAGVVFNFDSDTPGTLTSFSDTVAGLKATFGGPSAGVCDISSWPLALESGNAFVSGDASCGSAIDPFVPLTIDFDQDVFGITLNFAIGVFNGSDTLELTALENGSSVGTTSSSGSILNMVPEGILTFSGTFNSISLNTLGGSSLVIDNIDVNTINLNDERFLLDPVELPEPSGMAWIGCAVLGFAYRFRRS